MSKTTRATQALAKAGVSFTVHTYDYDPNADRVGIQEVDGQKVRVFRSNGAVVGAKA